LAKLEEQRKKVLNKILTIGVPVAVIALVLTVLVKTEIFLFLGGFAIVGVYYYFSRQYKANFKAGVIKRLVEFIDSSLRYDRTNHISRPLFSASKIFRHRIDRYKGDDYVAGKLGETVVEFSEVHAQYVTRDSKGRTRTHTIFKGLFFIADFNKHFKGTTVVLPDTAERIFGNLGTMFQSWNKMRGELVKLEDPEFEKIFVVYGDDQIEARYILSTSLMRRIVDFKKKTKRPIHLSFVGSKIYIAISYTRNLFEPRVFRTLLDFEPTRQYFEDLRLATDIVEDLNLNRRIWSKQ